MYIVLDIETGNPTAAQMEVEKRWAKTGNLKDPAKIEAKQNGLKGGLTDSAPIFCIGLRVPGLSLSLSTANLNDSARSILQSAGIAASTFANEIAMLQGFCAIMATLPATTRLTTRLITHNGTHFDIPKLRFRMSFYNLQAPDTLWTWKHTDTMLKFREFSVSDKQFYKLSELTEKFEIPFCKEINGDEIGGMIESNEPEQHLKIILYNTLDCIATECVARKMMGYKL